MCKYIKREGKKKRKERERGERESETANLPKIEAPRMGAMLYKYPN